MDVRLSIEGGGEGGRVRGWQGAQADGVLMPAHVVDHVPPAMKLFREESFGPVVAVVRARDEAHTIELANDTEFGLSAAGIDAFTELRWITIETQPGHFPILPFPEFQAQR